MRHRLIILDLDGTIYACEALQAVLHNELVTFISAEMNIGYQSADERLSALWAEGNDGNANGAGEIRFLREAGLDVGRWGDIVDGVRIGGFIHEDTILRAALEHVRAACSIVVATNSPAKFTNAVLHQVNIADLIDEVFCLGYRSADIVFPAEGKPSAELYFQISRRYRCPPSDCFVFGDRWEVDIKPAIACKMHATLVAGPSDLTKKLWMLGQ